MPMVVVSSGYKTNLNHVIYFDVVHGTHRKQAPDNTPYIYNLHTFVLYGPSRYLKITMK